MARRSTKTDLSRLNPSQLKAVTTINGIIQVGSVAGSGKTTVLTKRISYMIKDIGIEPDTILCATFTKKAGEEMIERLGKDLNKGQVRALRIGTFHSICYKMFKCEMRLMNDQMMYCELMTDSQAKGIIREIIEEFKAVDENDKYQVPNLLKRINENKLNLISPDAMIAQFLMENPSDKDKLFLKVFEEYEKRKDARKLIDFNDMIYKTYWMLVKYPRILEKYQRKIKYILVDEAQDNNRAQYMMIELLSEINKNIFVVGDDDQSIYRFRGAEPRLFIDFQNEHEGSILINLEENYRSLPFILEGANNLIRNNKVRIEKELKPFRQYKQGDHNTPTVVAFADEEDEALNVTEEIARTYTEENIKYSDMAVLYRTNAQARAMEDELIGHGIPYIVFNGISFYERAEIKDLICYLRLAMDQTDDEALLRVINTPNRYLGAKYVEGIKQVAQYKNAHLYNVLEYNMEGKLYGRTFSNVQNFKSNIAKITSYIKFNHSDSKTVADIVKFIIDTVDYESHLMRENGNEEDNIRLENVRSLVTGCRKFTDVQKFLDYVEIVTKAKHDDSVDAVKLMTIHKSKGLEYLAIFAIGLSEGLLPHKYAIEESAFSDDGIEEERRLAYVNLTRAKDKLHISSIDSFQGRDLQPSRFIMEAFSQYL